MNEYYKRLQESIDEKFMCAALDKGVSITDLYTRFDYRKNNLIQIYRNPESHYSKILVAAMIGVLSIDYGYSQKDRRDLRLI